MIATFEDIKRWTHRYNTDAIQSMWGALINTTVRDLVAKAEHSKEAQGLVLKLKDAELKLPQKAQSVLDKYSPPMQRTITDPAYS